MKKPNITKEHIIELLKENKPVLQKYGVKRIGLFGSYVRDRQKQNSDIDLA